jgi:hypothetical protein
MALGLPDGVKPLKPTLSSLRTNFAASSAVINFNAMIIFLVSYFRGAKVIEIAGLCPVWIEKNAGFLQIGIFHVPLQAN